MLLTVFTPTYNRVHTLERTFRSLCRQHFKDFEWLVVDDGSTDGTAELITGLRALADFPINYVAKENGGKHTAYNEGLRRARGRWFFTVDSDDWLPDDSLAHIADIAPEAEKDPRIAGIIALKEYPDGRLIGRPYPADLRRASLFELERNGHRGERSLVFKTEIARQYPFPVIAGEKFMTESVVYDRIAVHYDFMVSNLILTTCEYQPDGLSSDPYRIIAKNPGGYALYYAGRLDAARGVREFLRYALRYLGMARLSGRKIYQGKHRIAVGLLSPLGIPVAHFYRSRLC